MTARYQNRPLREFEIWGRAEPVHPSPEHRHQHHSLAQTVTHWNEHQWNAHAWARGLIRASDGSRCPCPAASLRRRKINQAAVFSIPSLVINKITSRWEIYKDGQSSGLTDMWKPTAEDGTCWQQLKRTLKETTAATETNRSKGSLMLSTGHSFVYKKRKQPPALSVGKDTLSPTGICRSLCSAVSIIFDGLDPLVPTCVGKRWFCDENGHI